MEVVIVTVLVIINKRNEEEILPIKYVIFTKNIL